MTTKQSKKYHGLMAAMATLKEKGVYLDPVIESRVQKELAMLQDPLIVATKKAYRGSLTYKVDMLYEERARWSRKLTIATNKLEKVDEQIEKLLVELGKKLDGLDKCHEKESKSATGASESK